MSQKRTQLDYSTSFSNKGNLDGNGNGNGDHNHNPDDKRRKSSSSFRGVVLEVMRQTSFQNAFEPILRKVVKEEVESAIRRHVMSLKRDNGEDVFPCELRNLQLKFLSTLSLPVFTGTRIEGEDGSAIKVALIDTATGEVVEYAPESCAKVEVVVLEGDFDGEDVENWTVDEFKSNIVREREGKKPLLTGDAYIYLKDGTGSVGEISFTDNSSWTRSRRFRLGARVIGNYEGARIREAKTESFIVRDHRGELYKKHYPPNLSDEVWRLEKIGKDGAFHKRLSIERVRTIKDFLILLHLDPARLRNILGSGMSAKMWEATVEHARTCVLDKRVYLYYSPVSQHRNGVVFNVVGQLIGIYMESQFVSVDEIPENDQVDLLRMVIEAFQHWDGVISFEDMNSLIGITSQAESSPMTETSDASKALIPQTVNRIDYAQPSIPSPDSFSPLYSLGCLSSPDDFSLQAIDDLNLKFDQPLDIPIEMSNTMFFPSGSMTQSFTDEEHLGFMDIDYPSIQSVNVSLGSQADLQNAYSGLMGAYSSGPAVRGPGRRRWRVLSSILRWFQIRKVVVTRRTPHPSAPRFW